MSELESGPAGESLPAHLGTLPNSPPQYGTAAGGSSGGAQARGDKQRAKLIPWVEFQLGAVTNGALRDLMHMQKNSCWGTGGLWSFITC